MLPLLKSRRILLLILLPSIFLAIFPKLWVDPFLIGLFYIAWETMVFPAFILIVIWSIIKYYLVGQNIGVEMLSLMFVWYYLNFFNFETKSRKVFSVITGSFIFIFINIFVPDIKGIWSVPMFFGFFVYFTCINLVFCWVIWSIKNVARFTV